MLLRLFIPLALVALAGSAGASSSMSTDLTLTLLRNERWIVAASRATKDEAVEAADMLRTKGGSYIPYSAIIKSANGWFAIVMGVVDSGRGDDVISDLVRNGTLPADTYLGDRTKLRHLVWLTEEFDEVAVGNDDERARAIVQALRDQIDDPAVLRNRLNRTTSAKLPQRVGDCVVARIAGIGPRLESAPDSGTSVVYDNGGFQTSYGILHPIRRSQIGDEVRICLQSIPKDCPPGDDRGRFYESRNLRTGEGWLASDSQHSCGGA